MRRLVLRAILAAGMLAAAVGLTLCLLAGLTFLRAMFVGVNVSTVLCYGYDKYMARTGGRRVPEAALHILAAAGGTPGAFLAQLLFRHKTRDRRFLAVFFAIAAIQVIALVTVSLLRHG